MLSHLSQIDALNPSMLRYILFCTPEKINKYRFRWYLFRHFQNFSKSTSNFLYFLSISTLIFPNQIFVSQNVRMYDIQNFLPLPVTLPSEFDEIEFSYQKLLPIIFIFLILSMREIYVGFWDTFPSGAYFLPQNRWTLH